MGRHGKLTSTDTNMDAEHRYYNNKIHILLYGATNVSSLAITWHCFCLLACDSHCLSQCTTDGGGKCDTLCAEGYARDPTSKTCVSE